MAIGHREAAYTRILFIISQQRREQSPGLFASFDVIVVVGVRLAVGEEVQSVVEHEAISGHHAAAPSTA